jgi:ATP-binding cassette subfamily B protein
MNRHDKVTVAREFRRADLDTVKTLLPYLLHYRWRVLLALVLLISAKVSNVGVPVVLKHIVDGLSQPQAILAVPFALLLGYGVLRLCTTMFADLRDIVFARVTQRVIRRAALAVFQHLHSLSLRFHLERQTGGVSRDIERGARGIDTLLSYAVFSVLPTLVEISLVMALLLTQFDHTFFIATLITLIVYITFTVGVTEWRMDFRRHANEMDSRANARAIDSLLNYETVKYFCNEEFEARRYDGSLSNWESAMVRARYSLAALNIGQSTIIACGVTVLMTLAAHGVVNREMSIGDLVMVNVLLVQLYIPLNFLGVIYREIKQALVDIEKMFGLLRQHREVDDRPGAQPLDAGSAPIAFEQVDFSYEPRRQILHSVSFAIPAGRTVAVVGASGSGKSTLARLLYRFYDVGGGRICINGQDIREVTQASVRRAIGIVPQDTVLFNDTIRYNIAYGDPNATEDDVIRAAKAAHIHDFITSLPDGYDSTVGERGLKLSGGEKQRVAIARTILKNPAVLILDEATSALDSRSEKAIQAELRDIAANRTTLIIAHRLSTVVDADQILVLERGRIIERGPHRFLLEKNGSYAAMWALQQQEEAEAIA